MYEFCRFFTNGVVNLFKYVKYQDAALPRVQKTRVLSLCYTNQLIASSIIYSILARVAPDFFRILMGLLLDVSSTCASPSRLFPTSSVTACGLPSLASASPSGRLLVAMSSRRPRISWLCSPI